MVRAAKIAEIKKSLDGQSWDYGYIGLRCVACSYDDYDAKIGDVLPSSWDWLDGDWTDNRLSGTSAVDITAIPSLDYDGDRVLVIGGHRSDYGQDPGEIIIRDAVVLMIINV